MKRKSADGPEAKRPLVEPQVSAPPKAATLVSAYSDTEDDVDQENKGKVGSAKLGLGLVGYGGDDEDDDDSD